MTSYRQRVIRADGRTLNIVRFALSVNITAPLYPNERQAVVERRIAFQDSDHLVAVLRDARRS